MNNNFAKIDIGIDEEKLKQLILDVLSYSEKIKAKFDIITGLIEESKLVYDSSFANSFFRKFENFKDNFNIINHNIQNYVNDLSKVRINFQKISMSATNYLKQESEEMKYE